MLLALLPLNLVTRTKRAGRAAEALARLYLPSRVCQEDAAMCGAESVGDMGVVWLGSADTDALQYVHIQARIAARAPIGIAGRAILTREIAHTLQALSPCQHTMAIALLYTMAAGIPGALDERVSAYLRWSLSFDAASEDVPLQVARARRQLSDAFTTARARLGAHYSLELVPDDAALATALASDCGERVAELDYACWSDDTSWLAPIHAQPVLDTLVRQPHSAALQITIERLASDALRDAPQLRLGIVALGHAAHPDALRALARELRGRGALATRPLPASSAPMVQAFRPTSAVDRERVNRNLSRPAAEPGAQALAQRDAVALTYDQVAQLLPLPFALFD